jgi:hypothetical protein
MTVGSRFRKPVRLFPGAWISLSKNMWTIFIWICAATCTVQRLFGCSDFFVRILPLHKLVCAGQLDLKTAQREIASNWIEAY